MRECCLLQDQVMASPRTMFKGCCLSCCSVPQVPAATQHTNLTLPLRMQTTLHHRNVTYGICITIAWVSFVKATGGTSPLEPGQWKPFLAFYAGLWTIQVRATMHPSCSIAMAMLGAQLFCCCITSRAGRYGRHEARFACCDATLSTCVHTWTHMTACPECTCTPFPCCMYFLLQKHAVLTPSPYMHSRPRTCRTLSAPRVLLSPSLWRPSLSA